MDLYASSSESEDEGPCRRQRTFRDRINYEGITDPFKFKEKFRMSATAAEEILTRIGGELRHQTLRNKALTPKQQLLLALHWLGNGSQYHGAADMHGVDKSTVCRSVRKVVEVIVEKMFPDEVQFPENTMINVVEKFYEKCNFPRVAGCIDGSLIPIDGPGARERAYVDRKGNHSLNAMAVCGPDLEFFYLSARWPGATHDARVLRRSSLFEEWEVNGWRPFPGAVLLGDSGYPLLEWLMTPITKPGVPQVGMDRFLRRHKSTRRLVENALGVLKEKFPCLNRLRVRPEYAGKIITACVTLHNVALRYGEVTGHLWDDGELGSKIGNY